MIDAVLVADPEVAVMVADPSATAVTRPADDTVATDELEVDHVTVAPDMVFPPLSFTVGTMAIVSPTDVNVFDVGERVTLDAA